MEQAFRLLKSQCAFCHRFRLARVAVHRYCCKLRLLNHGLLEDANAFDEETNALRSTKAKVKAGANTDSGSDSEDAEDPNYIITRHNRHMSKCLKRAKANATYVKDRHRVTEAVSEALNNVIAGFWRDISQPQRVPCSWCKGISPSYRKNRLLSIFRNPLNSKAATENAVAKVKMVNPLVELNAWKKKQLRELRRKAEREQRMEQNGLHSDEGVADLDTSPDELPEIDMMDIDDDFSDQSAEELPTADSDLMLEAPVTVGESQAQGANKSKNEDELRQVFMTPSEVHAALVQLFEMEKDILNEIYRSPATKSSKSPLSPDMFFITHLPVPPNRYRKESKTGANEIAESPQNRAYKEILTCSQTMFDTQNDLKGLAPEGSSRPRTFQELQKAWLNVQDRVNMLLDNTKGSRPPYPTTPDGLKQLLEKKEGLFRMNMMGKRVNFAARTVISPDPNIESNEVGVPPVFAQKLTYPEMVTQHNYAELQMAVVNGPSKWPGAAAIEYENGQVMSLRGKSDDDRRAIANLLLAPSSTAMTGVRNKKVHRHLNNGDIVIMNRQPTLHKPSMMCHRAKILPGEKTLRLHYANCKAYNADFDGDEMNMHFPQNELARSEALQIADTDHQYLSATAAEPLRGLIQDHISMSVWLTCVGSIFTRHQYQELLASCIRPEMNSLNGGDIRTIGPAILKPNPCWTGKQVINTILLNVKPASHDELSFESKSTVPPDRWGGLSAEDKVRMQRGDLITGILDAKQIGSKPDGLIHCIHEAYGPTVAGKFLSILGRLLTKLLNDRAFSCGMQDLILTPKGEADRKHVLQDARTVGFEVTAGYVSMGGRDMTDQDAELKSRIESVIRDNEKRNGLDVLTIGRNSRLSSAVTDKCLPTGLVKPFPNNQMQTMTTSGAKGSVVNANLISCNLGQQVLEGRRVPVMVSGRTLPAFEEFDTSIRANGYITGRFLTGIRPQEYFFHAMAGREGLIDTAVKTATSGYLQRCLMKGMEGLRAEYDSSVRDSDGTMIQALYGEDGLDVTRTSKLLDLNFTGSNFLSFYASAGTRDSYEKTQSLEAIEHNKKATKAASRLGAFTAIDPALSLFNPGRYSGSTSELYYTAVRKYMEENPHGIIRTKDKTKPSAIDSYRRADVLAVFFINYLRAVVQPGEAVGVIAAQSIGEPSTQMTLNTFHLAGHAAKNVTLGMPRLREILMAASKQIKTPTMTLHPWPEMTDDDCVTFARGISRLSLAELTESISIVEHEGSITSPNARTYKIEVCLYPSKEYTEEYQLSISDIADKLEHVFVPKLDDSISRQMKKATKAKSSSAVPEIGKSAGRREEARMPREGAEEGGASDADDDDATDPRKKNNREEGEFYQEADEDEAEILREHDKLSDADNSDSEVEDEAYESGDEDGIGRERASQILTKNKHVREFSYEEHDGDKIKLTMEYPTSSPKVLLMPIIKQVAKTTFVRELQNVGSATFVKATPSEPRTVAAEGVNLKLMRDEDILSCMDHTKFFTNDINAMLQVYGVEAARVTLIREVENVFKSHSITVNYRHLSLVADYMTREGTFSPFNRTGMRNKTHPFAKMSFETTMAFLKDTVLGQEYDDLNNPSSRLVVGRLGRMGTGMFDVLMPAAEADDEVKNEMA